MIKKSLIILAVVVLMLLSYNFYQKFTFEKQLNQKMRGFSNQQKGKIDSFINTNVNHNLSDQEVKNIVVDSLKEAGDKIIQAKMRNLNSSTNDYFALNQNYGTSSSNNICSSYDFVGAIAIIAKNSIIPANCVVSPNFPSKSFTLSVPSSNGNYKLYCNDPNGFVGEVDDNNQFIEGVKCK